MSRGLRPNVSHAALSGPQNKCMKLTTLSATPTLATQGALGRRRRLMPAPVDGMDAGTASPVMPGVGRTRWPRSESAWNG
jgi:hypothetical protein